MEPLVGRAQTIAKGWLLLLLERAPLDAVGTIPAAALAAEGPALCAAVVRGLGSDAELARLGPDGDLAPLVARLGPLCGAHDAGATVAAVEALRACIWATALESASAQAREPVAIAQLADRLAAVTAVVTASALPLGQSAVAASAPSSPGAAVPPPVAATADAPPPPAHEPQPHAAPPYAPEPPASHDGIPHPPHREEAAAAAGGAQPAWAQPAYDEEPDHPGSVTPLPARPPVDPRSGPAAAMDDSDLWIATLERHIDRCQREGGGLALLRVELVDGDRVAASAPDGQAHVPYGRLAQAIRRAIRRQDLVASDHHGRAWVIAPGVGRAGAIALAERIGAGVENGESWRGAPLAATIGFAVYGEDGRDAATLIDRAEEAMLAATAAGARIGEAAPHPEDLGGDPDRPGPRLVR